ncbi:MAG TPA: hypothetical protein VF057_10125 [Thermoanaerobaculia bacterium]
MRLVPAIAFSTLLAASVAAQEAAIRFVPSAPDSRTPIEIRVGGFWGDGTFPRCASANVTGGTIVVVAGCRPPVGIQVPSAWSATSSVGPLPAGRYGVIVRLDDGRQLAFTTLIVRDANPPFTLTPNVGHGSLFDLVRINAPGFFVCSQGATCGAPIVVFGGQAATVHGRGPDEVQVTPPSRDIPGTVDVEVRFDGRILRVENAFHYASSLVADPAFFEPILVPVYFKGPGAHGAQWQTELSVRNDTEFPLTAVPDPLARACFPICDPRLQGGTTVKLRPGNDGLVTGYVFHIPRQASPNVQFHLLVRDESRQAEALGTEVPVVREGDLFEGTFRLLNVPTDERFRIDLRLYAVDRPATMRLVIRDMFAPDILVSTEILSVPERLYLSNLRAMYPQIAASRSVRIDVEPVHAAAGRFWGFASITNNDTQHVTVISPQ